MLALSQATAPSRGLETIDTENIKLPCPLEPLKVPRAHITRKRLHGSPELAERISLKEACKSKPNLDKQKSNKDLNSDYSVYVLEDINNDFCPFILQRAVYGRQLPSLTPC